MSGINDEPSLANPIFGVTNCFAECPIEISAHEEFHAGYYGIRKLDICREHIRKFFASSERTMNDLGKSWL